MSGYLLNATGLPTDAVINLVVSDADGTWSRGLGFTADGTWSVVVADPTSPTTYEFVSTTFGKDGSKYWVYASCSAS